MLKKKETGTRQPELQEIIDAINAYRKQLHKDETISNTKFQHMQAGLHWAKQIVRDCYGAPRERRAVSWVK